MVPRSLVCGGLPLGARVVPRALGAPSRPGLSRGAHTVICTRISKCALDREPPLRTRPAGERARGDQDC